MRFVKLHGAGNDFILFEEGAGGIDRRRVAAVVPRLCHRRLGIGADGVLLVGRPEPGRVSVTYWNADGSEAAFCGNGTRCAARFAAERWGEHRVVVSTGYAEIPAEVVGTRVTLVLPLPSRLDPPCILRVGDGRIPVRYVEVGVPHLVVAVDWPDFWTAPLEPLAPRLRAHPDLSPEGANVNFYQAVGGRMRARFWERGVEGETLASGSGVVAVSLVAVAEGAVASPVEVETASGRRLVVEPGGGGRGPLRVTGPAEKVAEGEVAAELVADQVGGRVEG